MPRVMNDVNRFVVNIFGTTCCLTIDHAQRLERVLGLKWLLRVSALQGGKDLVGRAYPGFIWVVAVGEQDDPQPLGRDEGVVRTETSGGTGLVVPSGWFGGQGRLQTDGRLGVESYLRAIAFKQGFQGDWIPVALPSKALGHRADLEVARLGEGDRLCSDGASESAFNCRRT